jgi:hypothetical protein
MPPMRVPAAAEPFNINVPPQAAFMVIDMHDAARRATVSRQQPEIELVEDDALNDMEEGLHQSNSSHESGSEDSSVHSRTSHRSSATDLSQRSAHSHSLTEEKQEHTNDYVNIADQSLAFRISG